VRRDEVWVAALQVNERLVPVHDHGVAVVVWGAERLPHIGALGANGSRVGPIQLHVPPGYWVFWHRALSQRRPGPRTRATSRTVSPLSWLRP
jgi:hypothetical protein